MAVNPKIIMMVVDTLSTEKGRNTVMKIVMVILGLIMMIFTVFAGLISGLLDVVETTDLQNHWQYIKSNLSDIFRGMETEIDDDVRAEVYDFMPDFSINLSKAAINSEFDGNSLILYDSEEIPHVTIKTSFMSGEVSQPQYSSSHYYRGLSAADLGVEVNPRLWFKGFRSNVDDELFRTIAAVEP